MDNRALVSVIIPTKNEAKHIANCIKSVLNQTYPQSRIEIIVVDNDSSDRTQEIARQYTDKVYTKGPERSAQRNYGMLEKAQGKYVMYLDADMTLAETVVEECVKTVESAKGIIALYISEIVMGDKFWSKVRRFERSFYDATVIDCVRFIERDKFMKVGGFDESLTGPEDWDLDKKLRSIGQVSLIKTPIYHNEAEFNFKKYLSKKGYYAKSFDKYIAKWGKDDADIKKQFGMYYRFFGVFMERGKWRKMVAHPVLVLGMYWLKIVVGLVYLKTSFNTHK